MGWLSKHVYNFIYARVPRMCIDLVIRDDHNNVLLIWRDIDPGADSWHLPGGRIFFGETVDDAIERIAWNEAGVRVYNPELIGYMEFPNEVQFGQPRHSNSLVFRCYTNTHINSDDVAFFARAPQYMFDGHFNFLHRGGYL